MNINIENAFLTLARKIREQREHRVSRNIFVFRLRQCLKIKLIKCMKIMYLEIHKKYPSIIKVGRVVAGILTRTELCHFL